MDCDNCARMFFAQFGAIENLMTAALDIMPRLRRYKPVVAAVICSSLFICGLTTCTGVSLYTYCIRMCLCWVSVVAPSKMWCPTLTRHKAMSRVYQAGFKFDTWQKHGIQSVILAKWKATFYLRNRALAHWIKVWTLDWLGLLTYISVHIDR